MTVDLALVVFFCLVVLLIIQAWVLITGPRKSSLPLPPGPKPWPIIGNILDIPRSYAWIKVAGWKDVYGDVVSLSMLGKTTIFLNSFEAANDLLHKKSSIYSDRPRLVMLNEVVGWDWAFAMMPYGAEWRKQRKLFHEHFTSGAAKQYQPYHILESRLFLARLLSRPDSFSHQIRHLTASMIMRITYGIDIKESNDVFISAAEESAKTMIAAGLPGSFIVDFIPLLKCLPEWAPGAAFKRIGKVWREKVIYAKTLPYNATKDAIMQNQAPQSAVFSMLQSLYMKGSNGSDEEEDTIRSVAGVAYAAGADTTALTLQFFFLAMVMHPEAQVRAQAEIDSVIGDKRLPEFDDLPFLPYLQAVFMEVLRWHPAAPFIPAHVNTEDDEYRGRSIPKGAIILANAWAMLHDENIYPEPFKFRPERFLDENGQLNSKVRNPDEVAFGFGRRHCPGKYLASDFLSITMASILAVFNISHALDECGQPIPVRDEVTSGLTTCPKPFKCWIAPRSHRATELIRDSI